MLAKNCRGQNKNKVKSHINENISNFIRKPDYASFGNITIPPQ